MNADIMNLFRQTEGEIVRTVVKEYAKTDIAELAHDFEKHQVAGNHLKANRILLRITGAMIRTMVHLAKQNALMQDDYKRVQL